MTTAGQRVKGHSQLKPIIKSIAPLFYLSRIMGILPYDFGEFLNNQQLRLSTIGVLWSLAVVVVHCGQYHVALNNSFNQNWGGDTNTLTAVIGIFIVYMEPAMMTVGILICLFHQKTIITCFHRLAKVDERLQIITSKIIPGDKVKKLAIGLISFAVICEVGLVLFNFVQFQISDDILFQTYWWFCSGVPIFTDSITRLWYLILIYLVRLRLEAINNYLLELQTTFKEKKDKYMLINAKMAPKPRSDSIGYLGQEIIDPKQRHNRTINLIRSPKVHALPLEFGDTKEGFGKDNLNIFMMDTEFSWNTERAFVVEDKMDKKLIELARIQDELCEIAKLINRIFSISILLTMAYGFMSVTAQLYFLYCGLVGQVIPILFRSAESLTISTIYIAYTSAKCVSIIFISWKTKIESQKTGIYLHKLGNVVDENHFYHIVNHLSLKLLNNQLTLTASGFFDLDMATIYAVSILDWKFILYKQNSSFFFRLLER